MPKDSYQEALETLGSRIRELRKSKNLTLVDLEVLCGINHSDISRIENAQKNVELLTIVKLADALGVSIRDVFK